MVVNWTHPLAKVRGVSLVMSCQHARWWFPDNEQTSFSVVSIGPPLPPTPPLHSPGSKAELPAGVSGGAGKRVVVTGAAKNT